jgi:histidinol-phosphate aminotransferase
VGYGLLPEAVAEQLWKIKQPYNVNLAAQVAALASLADIEHLRGTVQCMIDERERVQAALRELPGLHVYPSQANFILCRVTSGDAAKLKHSLEQRGILVRYYRKPLLRDCIRISMGRPEQNDLLLAALCEVQG